MSQFEISPPTGGIRSIAGIDHLTSANADAAASKTAATGHRLACRLIAVYV